MANINDYIDWRGDISFDASPLNDIDNLIFTEFSFLDLAKIVPENYSDGFVTLSQAVDTYFRKYEDRARSLGYIIPDQIKVMAKKMAKSRRYADLHLTAYQSILDTDRQIQFCAVCIMLPNGSAFIAFRGTDDTLAGWHEDFNMMFTSPVPSQICANTYLCSLLAQFSGDVYVGGHSKGGNLAVYAASTCPSSVTKRILKIYNNDGPGFGSDFILSDGYRTIKDKIIRIIPQNSVVGLLFEHEDTYRIVKSNAKGIFQHDGFSWEVLGTDFVPFDSLTRDSIIVDKGIKSLISQMNEDERRRFVDAMFELLGASNAKTLTDLMQNKNAFIRSLKNVPAESRELFFRTIVKIISESGHAWLSTIKPSAKENKDL